MRPLQSAGLYPAQLPAASGVRCEGGLDVLFERLRERREKLDATEREPRARGCGFALGSPKPSVGDVHLASPAEHDGASSAGSDAVAEHLPCTASSPAALWMRASSGERRQLIARFIVLKEDP